MSGTSKLNTAFETTWRARVGTGKASVADPVTAPGKPTKPSGAVYYTQSSGADLFPELEWIKGVLNKLRRR